MLSCGEIAMGRMVEGVVMLEARDTCSGATGRFVRLHLVLNEGRGGLYRNLLAFSGLSSQKRRAYLAKYI